MNAAFEPPGFISHGVRMKKEYASVLEGKRKEISTLMWGATALLAPEIEVKARSGLYICCVVICSIEMDSITNSINVSIVAATQQTECAASLLPLPYNSNLSLLTNNFLFC